MPHKDPEARRQYAKAYKAEYEKRPAVAQRRKERERSPAYKAKKRERYQRLPVESKVADLARVENYRKTPRGRALTARTQARHAGVPWADDQLNVAVALLTESAVCSVCRRTEDINNRKFCIDHDHETGLIRGLLCGGCNSALGHASDDATRLRKLADYLDSHKSTRKVS